MRKAFVISAVLSVLFGMGATPAFADSEKAQEFKVNKGTSAAGDGNSVAINGSPLPLRGHPIKVGDALRPATVTTGNLTAVDMATKSGKVRVISVVPSLDTPTCGEQTHQLSEDNGNLPEGVEMVTISMDLPFAQKRFAKDAKITNVTFYSDYKTGEFGLNNGLLIDPLHLLARAVIVTDRDNVVRYIQVVPEVTDLPDLAAAMEVAKGLL